MKLNIYSIKDTVVGAFQAPIYMQNDGVVCRAVGNAVNSPSENPVKENYKDKQIFCLGVFDDENGQIIQTDVRFVCNLSDLVKVGE